MDLCDLTAAEMRQMLDKRDVSAVDLAKAHLGRIEDIDPKLNGFLTLNPDGAIEAADAAQAAIDAGNAKPLTGIPIALKDNIVTKGLRTTCASKILENWIPPYNATLTDRLAEEHAVVIGKTNLDEFAMGASTEYSAYFPTRNPWDLERVPGGSSGGSAVAVASRMAALAFGSDTGGSVRQPAALCGIVGFKPTYGRVSRYGLVAFSSSLDQIGPFARTVSDARWAFEAVFGADGRDSTCVDRPYSSDRAQVGDIKDLRIGLPVEMFSNDVDVAVLDVVRASLKKLESQGAVVEEFSAPMIEHGVSTYYIIAPAEASSNLARYDGVRYGSRSENNSHIDLMKATRANGFGREVKERIIIGTYVLSSGYYDAFYSKAHQARTLMKKQFQDAFAKYDVIASPTSPTTAFKIGERTHDPLALKLADYCTIPANIGGFPAITLNCGFASGLPVGLQFFANSFCEDILLSAALGVENVLALGTPMPTGIT